ncbi:conserved exported hypothetical protein [Bosea sp. 62]|uniref:hypothetical protein n=1 Tax=unclassified Bosea (in: a-proteobacteria) TaxID=2653178 RepID=UPI001258D484|nr:MULTISPECIES: hypothetical protein [unclassified Bosea (in: a-proteobacteria)]CAD5291401.1 conserved exported hypothetical protein [Bosea sp. 7B]CAD5299691.1 conserved exported hypothetical protein [Bosea sp. 21B]CAD5299817.1 conserved exported hypothetical protein [Bosea sp. 46]VVT61743.1 conserved exported hypothetical protein [Bosea sp. EC-HK365B]VXB03926.1 conserved exported hypothetical protein [Bosea sp. 127]
MTGRRQFALRLALIAGCALLAGRAGAEPVALPDGLVLDLPEGWRVDGPAEGETGKDGRTRIQLVCETEACKRTQETCTILMRSQPVIGADDAARLTSLYAAPMDRHFRIRAVLRSTSKDAQVLQPLARVALGSRDWWRIETDARHNYKSGLFAETVIDGRYLGVICKTCETGSERHQAGRAIMASVRPAD